MKNIKIIISSLVIGVFSLGIITPIVAYAATPTNAKQAVCEGAGLVSNGDTCDNPANSPDVNSTVAKGLNIFSAIIGIVAVVMIMVAGVKFVTSNGDSNAISSARTSIIYAIVGLVVVALAQFIAKFVLVKFTS